MQWYTWYAIGLMQGQAMQQAPPPPPKPPVVCEMLSPQPIAQCKWIQTKDAHD